MPTTNTIVTYDVLNQALNTNHESVMTEVTTEAEKAVDDPLERGMMLMGISSALKALEKEEPRGDVILATEHRVASLMQTYFARQALEASKEGADKVEPKKSSPVVGEDDYLEAKFDERDVVGWVGSFFTWWKRLRPHDFLYASPHPEQLPDKARVALLSDWGTGLYGAPVCTTSIQRDPDGYNLLMHLGDIYYSGDDDEVEERFLKYWAQVPGAVSRALNANHEMYTGGKAYFKQVLPAFGQQASYFAIQNNYFTLIGLDSAYRDHDLKDEQIDWLNTVIDQAGNRKVILFTHHQPISALGSQGVKMTDKIMHHLMARRIFAWYWGHEHRCMIYEQHPLWGFHGRCIGHGGYPYFRKELSDFAQEKGMNHSMWRTIPARNMNPSCIVLNGENPYVAGHEDEYGPNGYLTLELDGERLHEIVHAPDGTRLRERQIA